MCLEREEVGFNFVRNCQRRTGHSGDQEKDCWGSQACHDLQAFVSVLLLFLSGNP